jgi:(E)-4-hydroxy-3-methylbut-2-enyl-diphosphate synthase
MPSYQRISRRINIGKIPVGGGAPITIQSMTSTDTRNADATIRQIRILAEAGCDIVRVAVPDRRAVESLAAIIAGSPLPIVADIHFDSRLALGALKAGVHALRLNPGNIRDPEHLSRVSREAKARGIPIRVGVNGGSVQEQIVEKHLATGLDYVEAVAESLVESAIEQCEVLESFEFRDIKVSLKASSVPATVMACRKFAARTDYPIHLGVTEAGSRLRGSIKSAVGIGALLLDGIGDTIRVSLTGDPVQEIEAARLILESAGIRSAEPEIVSCPTCGRTKIDLAALADRVERMVAEVKRSGTPVRLRKIAVMGCSVNGPGEARDADLALTGSMDGRIVLFRNGKECGVFSEDEALSVLSSILRDSENP